MLSGQGVELFERIRRIKMCGFAWELCHGGRGEQGVEVSKAQARLSHVFPAPLSTDEDVELSAPSLDHVCRTPPYSPLSLPSVCICLPMPSAQPIQPVPSVNGRYFNSQPERAPPLAVPALSSRKARNLERTAAALLPETAAAHHQNG